MSFHTMLRNWNTRQIPESVGLFQNDGIENGDEMNIRDKSSDNFTDEALKDKIGSSLKRIYDDVVNEPVPDDFLNLLKQASEKK